MSRKKIGLALSGGGARGFAHIGVLKVLIENNIPIDMIAGTSAGSIVGGALASGMTVKEIEAMAAKVGWTNTLRPSLSPLGMMSTVPMGDFLRRHFKVSRFEDVAIPFAAVAYDLERGEIVVNMDSGELVAAVRASCSVPGIFAPLIDGDGRLLVDGGIVSPMPAKTVREMGADVVIAVDLLSCGATFRKRPKTAMGMMIRSAMTLLRNASIAEHVDADIVIEPQIAHLRPDQINKRDEFIKLGEAEAKERMPEILKLI